MYGVAFGLPAKAEETRRYGLHYDLLNNAAINAVNALGWRYNTYAPYQFSLRINASFWSWGELVNVNIYGDGTVYVGSQCSFPIQWFDWGKNKKNIARFFAMLDYYISQSMPPPAAQ